VVTTYADEDWVSLRDGDTVLLSFQRASDYQPPEWPIPDRPQQFRLDVTVDEARFDEAERQVLALGATKHELQPGGNWRSTSTPSATRSASAGTRARAPVAHGERPERS
jgi:hypothetical protein